MRLSSAIVTFLGLGLFFVGGAAAQSPPYPPSDVIEDIDFDWGSHIRLAPGSDNWVTTWSDDDHQYTSWGDGGGFGGGNRDARVSMGFARIEGTFDSYVGINVNGGKDPECPSSIDGKSYGLISLDGVLYMWRSPKSGRLSYEYFQLLKSTDKGCTWSEVGRGQWWQKDDGMILPGFLNFGQDNRLARDEFVYSYPIELQDGGGLNIQKPGAINLMRVRASQIEDRTAYEFFAGFDGNGNPTWSSDPSQREPVFEDPNGVGWNASVIFVPGIERYVLMTEHSASGQSNLTMAEAPEPWGPWRIVLYENGWASNQIEESAFYWNFAPKFFRNGGTEFTLIFTGYGANDSWNTVDGRFTASSVAQDTTPPSAPTGLRVVP